METEAVYYAEIFTYLIYIEHCSYEHVQFSLIIKLWCKIYKQRLNLLDKDHWTLSSNICAIFSN